MYSTLQTVKNKESGATYVEMAISILVFLMIFIAVIELLRYGYVSVSLQYIINNSIRRAAIADFNVNGCKLQENGTLHNSLIKNHAVNIDKKNNCIRQQVQKTAAELVKLNTNEITIGCADSSFSTASDRCTGSGDKGDYVSITIKHPHALFFGTIFGKGITITNSMIAKNEQFKTS